jgi:hypothetical protein
MDISRIHTVADLESALTAQNLPVSRLSENEILVDIRVGAETTRLLITFELEIIHFELYLTDLAPDVSLAEAALAVCQVNERLPLPGFNLYCEPRLLTYRASIPRSPDGLRIGLVTTLLTTCTGTVELYWPGLADAIWRTAPGGAFDYSPAAPAIAQGNRLEGYSLLSIPVFRPEPDADLRNRRSRNAKKI